MRTSTSTAPYPPRPLRLLSLVGHFHTESWSPWSQCGVHSTSSLKSLLMPPSDFSGSTGNNLDDTSNHPTIPDAVATAAILQRLESMKKNKYVRRANKREAPAPPPLLPTASATEKRSGTKVRRERGILSYTLGFSERLDVGRNRRGVRYRSRGCCRASKIS